MFLVHSKLHHRLNLWFVSGELFLCVAEQKSIQLVFKFRYRIIVHLRDKCLIFLSIIQNSKLISFDKSLPLRSCLGFLIGSKLSFDFLKLCLKFCFGLSVSINLLLNGKTEADWNQILNNSLFSGQGSMLIPYIALVLFTKVMATSATNGGGGCGGTFAPSLFIGCFTGFLFSRLWNMNEIGVYIPEKNFSLLGMAGVMSGVMHAPLTGIFLIAELTGGYSMFMPLMIVSVCAYLTIIIFEPHSIYGSRLAKQGKLITHHTDHAVLTLMNLDSVIEKDYLSVTPDMELGQIVHKISRSHSTVIPVLDAGGMLLGEIDIMKIRNVMFRIELYHHFMASQLMTDPKARLSDTTPMVDVMRAFDKTGANWLPVLDAENRLKGYISRQRIYTMYRKMVADMSED